MTATVATELKANFKYYMDRVVEGEQVIITRPKQKNVVLISEEAYNELIGIREREQETAARLLLYSLKLAEERAEREGWIPSEEAKKILGVSE